MASRGFAPTRPPATQAKSSPTMKSKLEEFGTLGGKMVFHVCFSLHGIGKPRGKRVRSEEVFSIAECNLEIFGSLQVTPEKRRKASGELRLFSEYLG